MDILRDAIVTGSIPPRQRLKQHWPCEVFGVSPGPIREALRQLESEGLVEHLPNRGTFVKKLSSEEFLGVLLPVRAAIEKCAVPLTASLMTAETLAELEAILSQMAYAAATDNLGTVDELDPEFPELLVRASGSGHALRPWQDVAPRVRAQIYQLSPRHRKLEDVVTEHRELLDEVKRNDPDALRQAIEHHIIDTARELLTAEPRLSVITPPD